MGRCSNDILLKKIGLSVLDQNTEIDFRLRRDLADCRKIDAQKPYAVSAAYTRNKYKKPENRFECMRKGCVNSGLIMMDEADEIALYKAQFDATQFAAGVVTFYVYPDASLVEADYPITVSFMVSEADAFTNADPYTVTIEKDMVTSDGFVPVMVNLANDPDSVIGNGWTPNEAGAYFRFSANKVVGYSSIAIFDSIDDFDLVDAVTISCLTTIGGTFDLEVLTQRCQESRYNDQVDTLTFPVTGTKVTPNWMNLFPMIKKGDREIGYDMTTVEKTIDANGEILLADANQDVCGYIAVQAADSCDVGEGTFVQSSAINAADVDEGHFIVRKNADGSTALVFSTEQAGVKVLVRYPKTVEIEELVANPENLNSSQLSMTVPFFTGDNQKYLYVFENVYVTSFPATITNEEATFAFTLTIGRDDDGNFFRVQKIIG